MVNANIRNIKETDSKELNIKLAGVKIKGPSIDLLSIEGPFSVKY